MGRHNPFQSEGSGITPAHGAAGGAMNLFDVSIPLAAALLCVDCDAICYAQMFCPVCAGTHFLNLASVLNRKPKEEAA